MEKTERKPDKMHIEKNILFFDLWAKGYDQGPIAWWLRSVQRKAVSMIEAPLSARILDASCGTGHGIELLWQKGFADITGLDLSREMLARARQRLGRGVRLVRGNVSKLPFAAGSFDLAVTTEAFHHYPDQALALREFLRVLSPKGTLLLVDVNFFFSCVHRLFEWLEPGCKKVNSALEIRTLAEEEGFAVIRQGRLGLFAVATIAKKRRHR